MKENHREIMFMFAYLLIFAALFFLALYDYHEGSALVDFGFEPELTNIFIMMLSLVGIIKTIYHLYRIKAD